MEDGAQRSIDRINEMLEYIGLSVRIKFLSDTVSSLWISLLEGIVQARLPNIHRPPPFLSSTSKLHNLEVLTETLESVFKIPKNHIKPLELLRKKAVQVSNLTDILWELHRQINFKKIDRNHDVNTDKLDEFQTFDSPSQSPILSEEFQSYIYENSPSFSKDKGQESEYSKEYKLEDINNNDQNIEQEFNQKGSRLSEEFETPAALKLKGNDTPHMKALKIKNINLLKLRARVETKKARKKEIKTIYTNALQSHKDSSLGDRNIPNPRFRKISENINENIFSTNAKNKDAAGEEFRATRFESDHNLLSAPEKNFYSYEEKIIKTIPLVQTGKIPFEEQERIWRKQLKTWGKALDDRIWARKVINKKKTDVNPNNLYEYQIALDSKLAASEVKRNQMSEIKKAKATIEEDMRQLKRMEHRIRQVEEVTSKVQRKEMLKEEMVVKGILDAYLKAQRDAIIEERKLEKEKRKTSEMKVKKVLESQKTFMMNQIDMLKDELEATKKDEVLLEKAYTEESRRLVREQKTNAVSSIRNVRMKLTSDWDGDEYRSEQAERLKKGINFSFVRNNK